MIFILSSLPGNLEFSSVNHTSVYEKYESSESNVFINIKFLGEIYSNWPKDLLGANMYKILEFCYDYYWQYYNVLILLQ